MTSRTIRHKETRAKTYDFPLAALESHHGQSDIAEETHYNMAASQGDAVTSDETNQQDEQQQLADVDDDGEVSSDEMDADAESGEARATATDGGDDASLERHIEQAIDALSELRTKL